MDAATSIATRPTPGQAPTPDDDHAALSSYDTTPGQNLGELTHTFTDHRVFEAHTPLAQVIDHFEQHPNDAGVLIKTDHGPLQPLFREHLFEHLARGFAREVFLKRSIQTYLDLQKPGTPPLTLPASTPIADAIHQALARPEDHRYDPVVVTFDVGQPILLDVRTLIDTQRLSLTEMLQVVEDQCHLAEHHATHDPLTGLENRQALLEHLEHTAVETAQHHTHYALLLLDLNRFKLLNDSLGHDAGDLLLIQIAERLEPALHQFIQHAAPQHPGLQGSLARQGGDEFVALLHPVANPEAAAALGLDLAQHLHQVMQPAFDLRGSRVFTSPSIGITTSALSDYDPRATLRDADAAMYRAKKTTTEPWAVFEPTLFQQSTQQLTLENDLRDALARDEIHTVFQPLFDCQSGRPVALEALARWTHPDRGPISPRDFIPLAEDTQLILPLGQRVLDQGLNRLAHCREQFPRLDLTLTVNTSVVELLSPGYTSHLQAALEQHAIPPDRLLVELREPSLIDHIHTTAPVLQQLRALGVRLGMDNFGNGTASLNRLHDLPIQTLKIDRGLVGQLDTSPAYTAVVHAVITLARTLGLTVVMKGIEKPEQLVQAQALDCHHAQGFLFAEPLHPIDLDRLLREPLPFPFPD